jgi:hypothetical protein
MPRYFLLPFRTIANHVGNVGFTAVTLATVSAMADMDGVLLPYEFLAKLGHLINSIPADEFEGALDDAQAEI